jgi:dUTP pyrophosphatase
MFQIEKTDLKIYKLWEEAHLPEYGSRLAACFDLKASLRLGDIVTVYDDRNVKGARKVSTNGEAQVSVTLYSGQRMLVPTGLVFDLSTTQSLRIHPRSGLSLKNGITVANCEGVVDSDYVQQTYVMLYNISTAPFDVLDGMRIAQGEIVRAIRVGLVEIDYEPENKSDRTGGFGSTGL